MSCTLKEHYQKIHSLNYNNDELNKVCIKVKPAVVPGIDGAPGTHPGDEEDELITEQQVLISAGAPHLKSEVEGGNLDLDNLQLNYISLRDVNPATDIRYASPDMAGDVTKYEK